MRIAIPDMAKDGHGYVLPFKEFFQITNQLADTPGWNDDIVDKVDRFLFWIKPVERWVQGFPCFPELLPPFSIERKHGR